MNKHNRFSARTQEVFASTGIPKQAITVRAATADAPAEILLYDEIGYFGVSAKDFLGAIAQAGAGPIKVRINSPGGDVFDGLAMYNALQTHPGGVTCVVDGLAASAASFIAMAGPCEMAPQSIMMIHRAWGIAVGNTNDMAETAGLLAKVDGQLAGIYSAKTGASTEDVMAALDAETWMTADEAKAGGYCDTITAPPKAKNGTETIITAAAPAVDTEADDWKLRARVRIAMAQ